jgi:hypothetical protein
MNLVLAVQGAGSGGGEDEMDGQYFPGEYLPYGWSSTVPVKYSTVRYLYQYWRSRIVGEDYCMYRTHFVRSRGRG